MSNFNNAQEKLQDLIFAALDHGIDSVKESGGPLIPFLMTETNGERTLQRFLTERLEDGVHQAQKLYKELEDKPDFAVIAFDGYLTMDDKKFDTIMVEAYDKTDKDSYALGQRYKPKKFLSKFAVIGNAVFLGSADGDSDEEEGNFFTFIMFRNAEIQMDVAESKLREAGLNVEKMNDSFKTSWDDGPVLIVTYSNGEDVQKDCQRIGMGTEFESDLENCNQRFEISFNDIEEVLDEMNTLIEVQGTLQEISNGIAFNSWNAELSK